MAQQSKGSRAGILTLLLACWAFSAEPASAWDAAGHMLVDQVAWAQTRPAAREKVSALVSTLEATYNGDQPYNFITVGCWMDDMRAKPGYAWSKWHYVNIPFTPTGLPCPIPTQGENVVWAIEHSLAILKTPASSPAARAESVAMLMHFVGDLHQPLHATERHDRGGNTFLIHGVPFSDLFPGTVPNLHAFWDKAFRFDMADSRIVEVWHAPSLRQRPDSPTSGIIAEEAAKLMARYPATRLPELAKPLSAAAWAEESHIIGCRFAYPPGEIPTNHEVVELSPEFVHGARAQAEARLVLAGDRLARLLNELFDPQPARTK